MRDIQIHDTRHRSSREIVQASCGLVRDAIVHGASNTLLICKLYSYRELVKIMTLTTRHSHCLAIRTSRFSTAEPEPL